MLHADYYRDVRRRKEFLNAEGRKTRGYEFAK